MQTQLLAENADIPKSEVLDFLYNFTDAFEEGKTVFRFWNTPGKKPTEVVLQYKKHPLLTRLQNPSAKMRAYELTPRGYELLEKFHKGVERIKKTYDLGYIAGIHKLSNFLEDRKAYAKKENVQDSSKKEIEKAPTKATKSLKSKEGKVQNVANFTLLQEPTKVFLEFEEKKSQDYYDKFADKQGAVGTDFLKENLKDLKKQNLREEPRGFINTEDFPVKPTISKITGIDSLKTIVAKKDDLRPVLTCVFIDKDCYIATDANNIILLNRPKNDGLKTGALYDPNYKCTKIEGCSKEEYYRDIYPGSINYKSVLTENPVYTSDWVAIEPIVQHLKSGLEVIRKIYDWKMVYVVKITSNAGEGHYRIKDLLNILQILQSNGAKKIRLYTNNLENKNLNIETDNGNIALTTPVYMGDRSNDVISQLRIAPIQLHFTQNREEEKGQNMAKETKEEDNFSKQVEKREALVKRADLYRKARKDGYSYDEIYKRAKELGDKDIDLIMNLSYLNPKGDMINSFLYHIDKEKEYLKMVNWTGEARRLYPDLDDKKEDFLCDLIDGDFYKEKTKDFFFKGIEDWHKRRTERANILKSILNKYKITLDYHSFNLFLEGISNDLYKNNYKELPEYDKYFFYFNLENKLNEKIINDLKKYFVNRIEEKKLKKVGLRDEKYSYKGELHQKGIEILRIIFKKLKEEKGLSGVNNFQGIFGTVPEVSTERFKQMSVPELREYTLEYYLENYGGKSLSKKFFKEEDIHIEFFNTAGKKLQKPIYKEKVAVLEHLESLIKNSTYNNWGNRKESSPPNIIGYLNFKAKVTIDGEKRHVRISIAVDEKRKFRFKTLEVGANPKKKKQATSIPAPWVTESLRDSSLSEDKVTKKSLSRKKKDENFGLNAPEAPVTSLPAPRQTLAQQLAKSPEVRESFLVADEQMSLFLGALEKKTKDSLVITLTGKQGSGKTRFAFQFMNALAQRYRVGHASIEEHPESVLYEEKAYQYLNDTALEHITAQDVRSLEELDTMIRTNEVIVIDSFQKMRELAPHFEIDKDLRKKYDGKLFLVIFQQTANGKMRGGSKSQFDGDIILFTETFPDYRENYVYPDKNRYNKRPATELQYSIYEQRMLATAPEVPAPPAHYEPTESEELNFEVL